ncbi:MAG: ribosome small subunit-dependent GTPase A [Oscillospiraceae bacterium]|nr:ribosome small subunit-dependent GTPase A [Oscillospiraceae bacterium]
MRGQIVKALSGFYYVATEGGIVTCRARGRFRKEGLSPLVGDFAEITVQPGGEGVLERIEERKNCFDRPSVANIDQLVIVCSQAIPQTDPFLVDRMTAIAELKGCEVLICINKCDLDRAEELVDYYTKTGYRTVAVSAETGEGVESLREFLCGKLSAFTGNSGVGKSSLLNALDSQFSIKVGEVSQALGRGRHTTRHVEIYDLESGARIIDTPGFSSFDTQKLELSLKEHLEETFPDFAPFLGECRFTGCSHTKEKGCAVLEALKAGKLVPRRHASYVRLHEELKNVKEWNAEEKR